MDDDASLPKATLNSFIKESIGSNLKSTQEFNELILEISNGFIKHLSSQANRLCAKEGKKTICPEFIFGALKEMGYGGFNEELEIAHGQYLEENQEKTKKKNKFNNLENWEELEAQQQKLFELSRNFNLPTEMIKKSEEEQKEQKHLTQTIDVEKENDDIIKEADNEKNNNFPFGDTFQKPNEEEDYENY